MSERDNIYQAAQGPVAAFAFDEAVARVFPDMIRRSVPGYTTIIPMIEVITRRYVQANTRLYDLGCSLGASLLAMRHGVNVPGCELIGVDNADAMLKRCQAYVDIDDAQTKVQLQLADVRDIAVHNASVVTLNFTLQFVPKDDRLALLHKIAAGTVPGGVLILSEKLSFDESEQQLQDALHHDFKRANGYSDMEISGKRSAIENVLIPESLEQHVSRLKAAGYSQVIKWYQCFNFVSIIAIK